MTFKELGKISYGFVDGMPFGRIDTKEQYDYMIYYNDKTNFGFYFGDDDRHIPTFEESKGKYLEQISFFGGASFFLILADHCTIYNKETDKFETAYPDFNYGKYGRITE